MTLPEPELVRTLRGFALLLHSGIGVAVEIFIIVLTAAGYDGDIAAHFDITAAAVSRHLAVLREAELIRDSREGKYIFYELNASVLEEILLWITELKGE